MKVRKTMAILLAVTLIPVGSMPVGAAKNSNSVQVQKKLTVEVGKTEKLKVTGKKIKKVIFSSSSKKIATVSKKGVVKGKKVGNCRIKVVVKCNLKSDKVLTCKVKVTAHKSGNIVEKATTTPSNTELPIATPMATVTPGAEVSPSMTPVATIVPTTTPEPIPYDSQEFEKSYAKTSLELLKYAASKEIQAGNNVMISPESVINALGMTMNGADGETLAEMKEVFCPNLTVDEYNQGVADFNASLVEDKYMKFHIANSMWVNQNSNTILSEEFKNKCGFYYRAQIFEEPFNGETVGKVNGWVNENTFQMIPSILSEINPNTLAILLNSIAFEGRWVSQYEDVEVLKDKTFTNAKGVQEPATMLTSVMGSYLQDEHAIGFTKEYVGRFDFVAMLPDEGISVSEYVNGLTVTKLKELIEKRSYADVYTQLPEFKYDYELSLVDFFKDVGIKKAFTSEAQFSKMGICPDGLRVDDVLHKTHIEVDRYGTKASAVTAVLVPGAAAPVEREKVYIYLNRPFFYAIVDEDTGLPVFAGIVNSVQ